MQRSYLLAATAALALLMQTPFALAQGRTGRRRNRGACGDNHRAGSDDDSAGCNQRHLQPADRLQEECVEEAGEEEDDAAAGDRSLG